MITKTFICDLCKKSVGESELFKVATAITIPKQKNSYSQKLASCDKDVCRECLEKKGLVTDAIENGDKKEEFQQNQKTFESKFVDFLEDIGVAFVE